MKIIKLQIISAILLLTAGAFTVNATAPANDNLANAVTLSGTTGTTGGTTVDATQENGEYSHGLSNSDMVYKTVWFEWTAAQTKPVVFEITAADFDSSMAVYTGSAHPLVSLARNNDTVGTRPRIELLAQSGTTYKIVVGVYNNPNTAGGNFTLGWTQNDSPTNDNFAQALNLENSSGFVAATNQNAAGEAQEPVFGDGKTVWFKFTNTSPNDFSLTFATRKSGNPSFDTSLAVYTGAAVNSLTAVVKNDNLPAMLKSGVTFLAKSGVTYRIAVDTRNQSVEGNILLSWEITKARYYTDFGTKIGTGGEINYDEGADITVYRPSTGIWYSLDSSNGAFSAFQFGLNGDTPVPADYDGDGRTDYAVTRNTGGAKIWYIRNSFNEDYTIVQWGLSGDKAVPGDYDADGRVDIAVFRPANNVWYILRSSDGQFFIKEFGLPGDVPVLGDFKGTPPGADLAVFRPSNGTWYIFDGTNTIFAPFGSNGDKPVPSDYDFDGKTDLAVFRPSGGVWYYLQSTNNEVKAVQWGLAGDIPMVGDFDNNSNDKDDFAVYRPGDKTWYILKSEGFVTEYREFGLSDDIPVSSLANLMQ